MLTQIHPKSRTRSICKSMIMISLFPSIILILIFSTTPPSKTTQILLPNFNLNYFNNTHNTIYPNLETTPTSLSHIAFGIVGVVKTWHARKHYVESWWCPNVTRGFLFLDKPPIQYLPWPPTSPPVRISNETTNRKGAHPIIRIPHVIQETFKAENEGVRWYVMADDDTVFFLENLVKVLKKYDHNGYYYVGMNAESILSNSLFSFGMGFGGAGFALSYPLAQALTKNLNVCLKRYHQFRFSDQLIQACVADIGVSLTPEKGFHQSLIGLMFAVIAVVVALFLVFKVQQRWPREADQTLPSPQERLPIRSTRFGSDPTVAIPDITKTVIEKFRSLLSLTAQHKIDLHGDISGLLSAHPQTPLVSLHHFDAVNPLFPAMDRLESLSHLMKAAKTDQSRILQQSICYNHSKNWSFSLSWGYSVHIYEKIIHPSVLQVPLQTFTEWRKGSRPAFMVNTRSTFTKDTCEIPHFFYFDSVEEPGGDGKQVVVTSYVRRFPRGLPPCLVARNHSADYVEKILVISPVKRLETEGSRRECCDIVEGDKANVTTIKLRPCMKYEILG